MDKEAYIRNSLPEATPWQVTHIGNLAEDLRYLLPNAELTWALDAIIAAITAYAVTEGNYNVQR